MEIADGDKTFSMPVAKAVLSPTRTYAPLIQEIFNHHRKDIHGMVHCSGGGQTKILHFVDQLHIIKDNLFPVPSLFNMIQQHSQTPWQEMYKVFNMGHRMEIYCSENVAGKLQQIASSFAIDSHIVGRVESSSSKKLTIRSEKGVFSY